MLCARYDRENAQRRMLACCWLGVLGTRRDRERARRRTIAVYWSSQLWGIDNRDNGREGHPDFIQNKETKRERVPRVRRKDAGLLGCSCVRLEKWKDATMGKGCGIRHLLQARMSLFYDRNSFQLM
jgi:hypothetical protein